MVIVLPQGRSEHNYAWPETYSVMIHHAVSGCFTCRKIIYFNLPSLQIHREHHILCKKLLWVAALSSPLHQALLWFWFFFFSPSKYITRYLLSEKGFRSLCLKEGVLASLCFSSYRTDGAHTALLAPPRSRNTSVHHCLPAVLQSHPDPSVQESVMQTFPFPPGRMV